MELSPSQEANRRPVSQEITCHLRKSDVHYHIYTTLVENLKICDVP
jgi:hypothetical protein